MNFDLTDEQEIVRDLAVQIFDGQASIDRLKELERSNDFDRELWKALADANLLGLCLPEAVGGSAMNMVAFALLAEQQGQHVAPVPLVPTVLTAITIAEAGGPELRSILARVIDGSLVLTSALAEAGANDVLSPTTIATPTLDGVHLRGFRPAVPYAQHAAFVLVPARDVDGTVALFAIETSAPGLVIEPVETTDRQPAAHVTLDCDVPAAHRLGDATTLAALYNRWLVALCAQQLGLAQGSLALTAEYVRTRQQFGKPLSSFQAVSQRAADAYITTEALRVTTMNAAWRLDEGLNAANDVLVAAFWASEGGQQVVLTGQHLHGGIGADVDYPVHRYFLWSSQLANTLGTASSHLARLGSRIAQPTDVAS